MQGRDMTEHRNTPPPNGGTALSVEDLHKSFGKLEVLKGVSATAEEGDVVSIIGASGSGKSTMLRCINLLETPNSGRIWVGGELIRMKQAGRRGMVPESQRQVDRIRSTVGMVFQSFNLWTHMTVMQNLVEAPIHVLKLPKAEAHERAESLLQRVGLIDKRDHYPAHLSGGQQQRAAIARTIVKDPYILILDDATSSVDIETETEIRAALEGLMKGRTTFIIAHRIQSVMIADLIVVLDGGRIKQIGSHEELLGQDGTYREIFDIQTRIEAELEKEIASAVG